MSDTSSLPSPAHIVQDQGSSLKNNILDPGATKQQNEPAADAVRETVVTLPSNLPRHVKQLVLDATSAGVAVRLGRVAFQSYGYEHNRISASEPFTANWALAGDSSVDPRQVFSSYRYKDDASSYESDTVVVDASTYGVRLVRLKTPPLADEQVAADEGGFTAAECAAALGMPLASMLVAHRIGEGPQDMAIVVAADSIAPALAGAQINPRFASDPAKSSRGPWECAFPLPGNFTRQWFWSTPASQDAFFANLISPPPMSAALARAISGGADELWHMVCSYAQEARERAASEAAQEAERQRLTAAWCPVPITLASLTADPPRPDLVPGLIPQGVVGVVYGEPGSGKTFALLSIGAHLARGLTLDGQQRPACLVICASGDDDRRDFGVRAQAVRQRYGLVDADPFHVCGSVPNLRDPTAVEAFTAYVAQLADKHSGLPILIILETLSAVLGPDGDDASRLDVKPVLEAASRIARQFDATIVLTHHTTKGGDQWRGDSTILADTAFMVAVEPQRGEGTRLRSTRIKSGRKGATLHGRRVPFTISLGSGEEASTAVMEWVRFAPPSDAPQVASQANSAQPEAGGTDQRTTAASERTDALVHAIRKAIATAPVAHDDDRGRLIRAAPFSAVQEAFYSALLGPQPRRGSAHRNAWMRALKALLSSGIVQQSADSKLLWLANAAASQADDKGIE
ncbi:AAA family ATPase [Methylobacterium oxalidis]|uniref:AAA family ATPase n=1 Tax=Methylobacterium oxalidis TaxID=944322 RepID=UPI003315A0C7